MTADRHLSSPLGEIAFRHLEDGSLWISSFEPAASARQMPPLELLQSLIAVIKADVAAAVRAAA
jgi:hypothetical protein